jgi:hypothetical protein
MSVWTLHATKRNTRASLSPGPEEDRRGDRHLSGTRQRLCVDIYHVIYYVMNDADNEDGIQKMTYPSGAGALYNFSIRFVTVLNEKNFF